MKTFIIITIQVILFAIAYEFACLPWWQYLIVMGLIMLAYEIGRALYVNH